METLKKTSLFWDVDLGELDPSAHADFIIRRILARGDVEDIKWMFGEFGKEKTEEVFLNAAHSLDPKSFSFWCLYFNVDKKACTRRSSIQPHSPFLSR